MASRSILKAAAGVLLVCLVPPLSCYAQSPKGNAAKEQKPQEAATTKGPKIVPPSGAAFYIAPMQEIPGQFSLLFSDADNRTVTDSFRIEQLVVFEAILTEAKQFAQTDEAVGLKKPITTRFFDKKEPALIVDVAKLGNRSQFVLTIKCLTGRLTMDAGSIKRGVEKGTPPLLYEILSRIHEAKEAAQGQQ